METYVVTGEDATFNVDGALRYAHTVPDLIDLVKSLYAASQGCAQAFSCDAEQTFLNRAHILCRDYIARVPLANRDATYQAYRAAAQKELDDAVGTESNLLTLFWRISTK